MNFEPDSCSHLADNDLEGVVKAFESDVELDPKDVAVIKYTPSVDNPHGAYADEVYYPPINTAKAQEALREKILGPNAVDLDMEDPYADYIVKRAWSPQIHYRNSPHYYDDYPSRHRFGEKNTGDALEYLEQYENDLPDKLLYQNNHAALFQPNYPSAEELLEMYPITKLLNDLHLSPKEIQKMLTPEKYEKLGDLLAQFDDRMEKEKRLLKRRKNSFYYEIPKWKSGFSYDIRPEKKISSKRQKGNERRSNTVKPRPGVYTEGEHRVIIAATPKEQNQMVLKDNLDQLLEKYNLGFKRPERLDVKKPGPPFDAQITENAQKVSAGKNAAQKVQNNAEDNMHKVSEENALLPSMMKKEPRGVHPYHDTMHEPGSDYVYVGFKNSLPSWKQGKNIIGTISALLRLEPQTFVDGRSLPYSVVFKVTPNNRGLNATEVAKQIETIKDQLQDSTGVEVTSIGVGDSLNRQTVVSVPLNNQQQFYVVIFLVCGVLAAMIIAAACLILIRRHIKSKEKLQGLTKPETEASKDYQDLCRARMAAKGQPAGESVHGKITSLSRESEQSPSSRSSTSSWSEEPALHNMDISTGHMVLSYMEDHLKNKDRLEQEWVALCAYVAEPCETTVAQKKENVDKNRYPEIVPYDHARVVLNELSNASGSDYINASSITDHDPRNPAYIATQGPLPHTAAEFWQLIWEQGAVVIVMLSRLTEGGAAMCHRYWPEEGSELYHIYEVHLVSEHIWCDDYLVRSFYLKNVRTGETRTVTQFHFLSWPESGVPASTKALLEFRRKVNKSYRGRSCPIVVHCSDGAGRTGTYCLIDMVLSRMAKGAKEIDIAATLEHLRDQRRNMVATKQQFEFVLTAVAEEVHAILKALPPQPSPAQTQEKEK
ncbi:hypothetical protein NQ317_010499 [Molorchus minor]|uniref:Receptor-type tyrosine-protein phosphatase N2 n=1 Tax=Molorchus minor TaxID=1323400 RepID=A0ABQ9J015_9CUCU|nr:hypothetical protein NQ317_010499 [Molorchus minor]